MLVEELPKIDYQISYLQELLSRLSSTHSIFEKLSVLDQEETVLNFFAKNERVAALIKQLDFQGQFVAKSIIAIEQAETVFFIPEYFEETLQAFEELICDLTWVEQFYQSIGGVIGYHLKTLELLQEKEVQKEVEFEHPVGLNVTHCNEEVKEKICQAIEYLPCVMELYPIGGAGDRLDLRDEKGNALPAAQLELEGRSLLEGLIRSLQSREYLYYKVYGKQLEIPVAMMTSQEKDNHRRVQELCEANAYFGKSKRSFLFFSQRSVPVLTFEGHWSMKAPLQLFKKPGGHGVIWKLAEEAKVFEKLSKKGIQKILVRQINNPVADSDYGLLAFLGEGISTNRLFGFASCLREVGSSEGMNVLIKKRVGEAYLYSISNVEYTDFVKHGIQDKPLDPDSNYSKYPSNTNILFADLKTIQNLVNKNPFFGLTLNMKTDVPFTDAKGDTTFVRGGRVESMMQNIADAIEDTCVDELHLDEKKKLKSFITYNERRKTISVTKKKFQKDSSPLETPVSAYYTLQGNRRDILEQYCGFLFPKSQSLDSFIKKGPEVLLSYHPALGPIHSIISQKIRGGELASQSELDLEIVDVDIENLQLDGSLRVLAANAMGHKNDNRYIHYSSQTGKCTLKNVRVVNEGVDYSKENIFWRGQIQRKETLDIFLQGHSEFHAENVVFAGKFAIKVPHGYKMTAYMDERGILSFRKDKLEASSWRWVYKLVGKDIVLKKKYSA